MLAENQRTVALNKIESQKFVDGLGPATFVADLLDLGGDQLVVHLIDLDSKGNVVSRWSRQICVTPLIHNALCARFLD